MKHIATGVCFISFLFLFVSCENAPQGDTFKALTVNGKTVIKGDRTGLMWHHYDENDWMTKFTKVKGTEIQKYCEELGWAGYTDWRVPTLEELRMAVKGYGDLESGGRCAVEEGCLQFTCKDKGTDGDTDYPCGNRESSLNNKGPGPKGCYWDAAFGDLCGTYWTNTPVEGMAEYNWVISFNEPTLLFMHQDHAANIAFIRCVRAGK